MGSGSENTDMRDGMDNKDSIIVPHDITRYAFEAVMVMTERQIKRLTVALVVAILGIVISNLAWLYCWMQYDYSAVENGVEVSAEAENGGNASYIGTRGMIINGKSDGTELFTESDTDTENFLK